MTLLKELRMRHFVFLLGLFMEKKKKKFVVCEMQLVLECLNFIPKRAS